MLFVALGCDGGSGSVVKGAVTYDGAPIVKGNITFTPVDGKGPVVGGEILNGQYTVEGLLPGKKNVLISAADNSAPILSSADMAKAAQSGRSPAPVPKETVPANAVGNGATIEVQAGTQTHDVALKKPETK